MPSPAAPSAGPPSLELSATALDGVRRSLAGSSQIRYAPDPGRSGPNPVGHRCDGPRCHPSPLIIIILNMRTTFTRERCSRSPYPCGHSMMALQQHLHYWCLKMLRTRHLKFPYFARRAEAKCYLWLQRGTSLGSFVRWRRPAGQSLIRVEFKCV